MGASRTRRSATEDVRKGGISVHGRRLGIIATEVSTLLLLRAIIRHRWFAVGPGKRVGRRLACPAPTVSNRKNSDEGVGVN